jgi:large subunit ribosomal protein L24
MHFNKDDQVIIIAGAHKGKQGRVMRTNDELDQVFVQGLNLRFKHIRRSQKHPRGGRVQMEAPIHVSNVALLDPASAKSKKPKATRVGVRVGDDGVKVRYAKSSGEPIPKPGRKAGQR